MKSLVVEDNFVERKLMVSFLLPYGQCHVAVNGSESIDAFRDALVEQDPYDLICLDIIMPEMDGHEVLKKIREIEAQNNIGGNDMCKVIMTSVLDDKKNIIGSFFEGCEIYLVKPITKDKFTNELIKLNLI